MNRNILVALESSETINKELLVEGSRIAALLGGNLYALITKQFAYSSMAWAQSAKELLHEMPFRLLLFAHTDKGRELAPLVAHALNASAVLDCFDIRFRNETLYYARYVHGGQFEQEVFFTNSPEIASLSLESLENSVGIATAPVDFKTIRLEVPEVEDGKRTVGIVPPDFRTMDISHAARILDIGVGCDRPDLLELAEELAVVLEASIGTTRLVVDSGRISKNRMIGQTGKKVSPELCLTLGVSGSPHHVAGLQRGAKIFAVNSDERAPIFGVSDAGFVSDLNSVLPKLLDRIRQYRDKDLT